MYVFIKRVSERAPDLFEDTQLGVVSYLPSPRNFSPLTVTSITKVGRWTGPRCSTVTYSKSGFSSLRVTTAFLGWIGPTPPHPPHPGRPPPGPPRLLPLAPPFRFLLLLPPPGAVNNSGNLRSVLAWEGIAACHVPNKYASKPLSQIRINWMKGRTLD